jgi:hypothetical protein
LAEYQRRRQREGPGVPVPPPPTAPDYRATRSQEVLDEAYARSLEQSFRVSAPRQGTTAAAAALRSSNRGTSSNKGMKQPNTVTTPATSRSNSLVGDIGLESVILEEDEALARRVEQELVDEDFARSLTLQDQDRASTARAARPVPRQKSTFRRCVCYLLPLGVIAASVAAILYFFVFGSETLPNWMPDPEEFANEDPFRQQDPSQTSRWANNGRGIDLTIINSLDDDWYPYFYTAVAEWDSGTPDSLTLKTTQGEPDYACSTVPRTLKVCNGNYGETTWRGINKLLLQDGTIYASAARMNEFYFAGNHKDLDQRQYTMCHEIGHGFGLPHTDESFTNADLGNCMDYTNRPANNRQPATANFVFLKELYGVIPGSEPEVVDQGATSQQESVIVTNVPTDTPVADQSEQQQKPKGKGNKRKLVRTRGPRGGRSRNDSRSLSSSLPQRALRSLEVVDAEIELGVSAITHENGWRLLHRSTHGEAHEKHLGDGFSVQVHLLLA